MGRPKKNLTGQRFGYLTVLEEAEKDNTEQLQWHCQCDCGKQVIVRGSDLRSKSTTSCGCYRKRKLTKHGQSTRTRGETSTYQCWKTMLARCYNPNNISYKNYGGRGIRVYRKWWKFKNFYKDMGDKPKGLTLERINNDGDYRPSNCKWATQQEQNRNIRCKGYSWNKNRQKWHAYIAVNRKMIYLGLHENEKDAQQAYLEAKKIHHFRKDDIKNEIRGLFK